MTVLAMPVYAANPPIGWQLEHTTVVTSPQDRKRTKVGVGEKVDLKTPCPADWTIQGGGTLSTTTEDGCGKLSWIFQPRYLQ